jgi:hypothetical protein
VDAGETGYRQPFRQGGCGSEGIFIDKQDAYFREYARTYTDLPMQ